MYIIYTQLYVSTTYVGILRTFRYTKHKNQNYNCNISYGVRRRCLDYSYNFGFYVLHIRRPLNDYVAG